jgi:hypothetical protein
VARTAAALAVALLLAFAGSAGAVPPHSNFVTGLDGGMGSQPEVKAFDGVSLAVTNDFFAFNPAFTGGVRVAVGDVNGDGTPDFVLAAGAGGAPEVKVLDGTNTSTVLADFFAYGAGFTGGVYVAAGDVNGDGRADIITGAGPGSTPEVKVFSGNGLGVLIDFLAYGAGFSGGVRVAAGDLDGDNHADVITGPGPGGTPNVKVFRATDALVLDNFFAYDAAYTGGIFVGAGYVNIDGIADIVTGTDSGAEPEVKVFRNGDVNSLLYDFFAYAPGFTGGVRVAAGDVDGDGRADVITGTGSGATEVKSFSGANGSAQHDFIAYGAATYGVFVASQPVARPTAVAFTRARGRRVPGGVRLHWRTASEAGAASFRVLRRAGRREVALGSIRAAGHISGASYTWLDRRAPRRGALRYRVELVRPDGSIVDAASVLVGP